MNVVSLFRVSTDRQRTDGASLAAQQARFRELAASNGWTTCAEVSGAESATKPGDERELLQATLRAIDAHNADALYVHEQSRLSRGDELEWARLMVALRARGCKVIVNGLIRDPASIDDGFMLRIQAAVDGAESARIRERCDRGKRQRAREGRRIAGGPPRGYTGGGKQGALTVIADEAVTVAEVFRRYARGESIRGICRDMGLAKSSVSFLLDNPAYAGVNASYRFHRGERGTVIPTPERAVVTPGTHPAIVDAETWARVRDRRERRVRNGGKPTVLRGLLHLNGSPAEGVSGHGKRLYGVERGPQLDREGVEGLVWRRFIDVLLSPAFIVELEAGEAEAPVELPGRSGGAPAIARLERRLAGLTTMRADGELSAAEYRQRAGEVRERLAEAKRAGGTWCAKVELGAPVAERVASTLSMAMHAAGPDQRRLLDLFVSRIDATAERQGAFQRDSRGRILHGGGPRWACTGLSFQCAAPGVLSCSRGQTASTALTIEVVAAGEPVLRYSRVALPPVAASLTKRGCA